MPLLSFILVNSFLLNTHTIYKILSLTDESCIFRINWTKVYYSNNQKYLMLNDHPLWNYHQPRGRLIKFYIDVSLKTPFTIFLTMREFMERPYPFGRVRYGLLLLKKVKTYLINALKKYFNITFTTFWCLLQKIVLNAGQMLCLLSYRNISDQFTYNI